MCKVMQEIVEEERMQERMQERKIAIRNMINVGIPKEKILELGYEEELYNAVEQEMLTTA